MQTSLVGVGTPAFYNCNRGTGKPALTSKLIEVFSLTISFEMAIVQKYKQAPTPTKEALTYECRDLAPHLRSYDKLPVFRLRGSLGLKN